MGAREWPLHGKFAICIVETVIMTERKIQLYCYQSCMRFRGALILCACSAMKDHIVVFTIDLNVPVVLCTCIAMTFMCLQG